MSNRLQRSMALMDAKADVKMIKERANVNWYDTKMLANAVYLILEELTATNTADTPQTKTQTETQNSNLTFENRTMRDCYNCKRYEAEGECIECNYEPKDEPQTDCDHKCIQTEIGCEQTDCAWK